jgi:hypothetical protein
MPRYFLHIVDRGRRIPDEHGTELADLGAARLEAVRVINELFESATWTRERHSANYIDITDEQDQLRDTVAVWEVVVRDTKK